MSNFSKMSAQTSSSPHSISWHQKEFYRCSLSFCFRVSLPFRIIAFIRSIYYRCKCLNENECKINEKKRLSSISEANRGLCAFSLNCSFNTFDYQHYWNGIYYQMKCNYLISFSNRCTALNTLTDDFISLFVPKQNRFTNIRRFLCIFSIDSNYSDQHSHNEGIQRLWIRVIYW